MCVIYLVLSLPSFFSPYNFSYFSKNFNILGKGVQNQYTQLVCGLFQITMLQKLVLQNMFFSILLLVMPIKFSPN